MREPIALVAAMAVGLTSCSAQGPVHRVGGQYPPFAMRRLEGRTIPGLPPVTGRIQVDQFGYLPDATKVAVLSDPVEGYNAADDYVPGPRLEVRRRSDGKAVHTGAPRVWKGGATDPMSGDRGWWFDFSAVREPGEYYVFDPANGVRSPVFRIADDVYRPVLRAAVRTYFYQREAVPLQPPHAEEPWVGGPIFLQDKKARSVLDRNNPATERDLHGGWMDAGDTNKYPPFNNDVVHPLLYAYRRNPKVFTDDFGIPESGNGLPDLLDELKFQLDWLMRMQEPDGGVWVKMGDIDYNGKYPLEQDDRPRFYGPKCTGAAISVASQFAHAARVYGQFEPWKEYARTLQQRAERAWRYYQTHPKTPNSDDGTIKSGNASRSVEDQERIEAVAAIHLLALTGKQEYADAAKRRIPSLRQMSEGIWSPYEFGMGEALLDYLELPQADPQLKERIRRQLQTSAESPQWAPPIEEDLYRAWVNADSYHWGSVVPRASFGYGALSAARVLQDDAVRRRLRERAAGLLHWFHGVNPLSAVMLTNMGRHGAELSVMRFWHGRWGFGTPFADNPPPGYLVGGPNKSYGGTNGDRKGDVSWIAKQPRAKAYADFNEPWPMNSWEITENSTGYQANYIRLLAEFVR
ncbi:MAG: glycoside hydrolase family 9 protein [Fimbriimonadales bacterium]